MRPANTLIAHIYAELRWPWGGGKKITRSGLSLKLKGGDLGDASFQANLRY